MSGRSKKAYPEGRHVPYSLCMEYLPGRTAQRYLRPVQTHATSHNIISCCWLTMLRPFVRARKFDGFQTIRNNCQHCCGSMQTAGGNMLGPQCCVLVAKNVGVRLHGPLKVLKISDACKQNNTAQET